MLPEAQCHPSSLGTIGHLDIGHLDIGHLETGYSDVGHLDAGYSDVGQSTIGHLGMLIHHETPTLPMSDKSVINLVSPFYNVI